MKFYFKFLLNSIIAISVFVIAYWGITYTIDWDGYEYFFLNEDSSRDHMFSLLAVQFHNVGFDFQDLFRFHILIIAVLYVCFINQNKRNPILFGLLILFANYVAIGNQIRYYVAFPASLIAFFYYVNNKKKAYLILTILASLFHYSILLFHALFLVNYYLIKKKSITFQLMWIIIMNITLFVILNSNTIFVEERYKDYFVSEQTSSILGGILNVLPAVIALFFICKLNIMTIKSKNSIRFSKNYIFLYTCSAASSMLIMPSLKTQILGSRMILVLLPIWIMYFLMCRVHGNIDIKKQSNIAIYISLSVFFFWRFCSSYFFGVGNEYINEAVLMLNSYTL